MLSSGASVEKAAAEFGTSPHMILQKASVLGIQLKATLRDKYQAPEKSGELLVLELKNRRVIVIS
jgi:hypothetical protein